MAWADSEQRRRAVARELQETTFAGRLHPRDRLGKFRGIGSMSLAARSRSATSLAKDTSMTPEMAGLLALRERGVQPQPMSRVLLRQWSAFDSNRHTGFIDANNGKHYGLDEAWKFDADHPVIPTVRAADASGLSDYTEVRGEHVGHGLTVTEKNGQLFVLFGTGPRRKRSQARDASTPLVRLAEHPGASWIGSRGTWYGNRPAYMAEGRRRVGGWQDSEARARAIDAKLQEAGRYTEGLHPRDRRGQFVRVNLSAASHGLIKDALAEQRDPSGASAGKLESRIRAHPVGSGPISLSRANLVEITDALRHFHRHSRRDPHPLTVKLSDQMRKMDTPDPAAKPPASPRVPKLSREEQKGAARGHAAMKKSNAAEMARLRRRRESAAGARAPKQPDPYAHLSGGKDSGFVDVKAWDPDSGQFVRVQRWANGRWTMEGNYGQKDLSPDRARSLETAATSEKPFVVYHRGMGTGHDSREKAMAELRSLRADVDDDPDRYEGESWPYMLDFKAGKKVGGG